MVAEISNIKIFTIGAYGYNENSFMAALKSKNVDTFCDIRLRRGMRGSVFAWANSNRLQTKMNEFGINYVHLKSLAPSKEIRDEQKAEDLKWGVSKRERTKLGRLFIDLYKEICEVNINDFFKELPATSKNVVLFCVEKEPEACHRSILADYLCGKFNLENGGDIGGWRR